MTGRLKNPWIGVVVALIGLATAYYKSATARDELAAEQARSHNEMLDSIRDTQQSLRRALDGIQEREVDLARRLGRLEGRALAKRALHSLGVEVHEAVPTVEEKDEEKPAIKPKGQLVKFKPLPARR